ncbi:MAG: CNNM domain-containing protein [Verrucomicrobiota bacterium]|nr:CNNM domain-containing protein [Verrucomicrobiota bacterium]
MIDLIIIFLSFLFSGLFSGIETGSYSVNRIKLKRKVLERNSEAERLNSIISSPYKFIFMVLIGNNIAIYLLSNQVTHIYLKNGFSANSLIFGFLPWNAEVIATLTLIFPVFLFAEIIPKNIFRIWADDIMYSLSIFIKTCNILFTPLTWPIEMFFKLIISDENKNMSALLYKVSPNTLKEELSLIKENEVISKFQVMMIENVINMYKIPVTSIMQSSKKASLISANSTVKDAKEIMKKNKYKDIFILENNKIIGIISSNDLLIRKYDDND